MKVVYYIDAPRDKGALSVDGQLKWALEAAESQGQELLAKMQASVGDDPAAVELVETFVAVDTHDAGMFGISVPRVRLAVALAIEPT